MRCRRVDVEVFASRDLELWSRAADAGTWRRQRGIELGDVLQV